MLYVLIAFAIFLGFLVSSFLLFGISKFFKIQGATFKISALATLLTSAASILFIAIFKLIGLGISAQITSMVVVFFAFKYLFKKYYDISWKKSLAVYASHLVLGILLSTLTIIPVRRFLFEPFVIAGDSMSPTLNAGEYIIIQKFDHNFKRGEIVVFETPASKAYFIKRVIGLPGEKVSAKNGQILIDNKVLTAPYVASSTSGNALTVLADDEYFVLSDNRNPSLDSITFGPIKREAIVGKILVKPEIPLLAK